MRAALLEYLRNHVSSRGDRQEVYLRSNADDFCGVSYRISYQRHNTQAATIAVRSSWPMDLELDFYTDDTQRNWLRAVCMDGPSHVTLTPTSSSSAILSWTLRPDEEETEDALRIISWLSRLRCAVPLVAQRTPPALRVPACEAQAPSCTASVKASAFPSWSALRPAAIATTSLQACSFEVLSVGLRRDIQHILAGEPTAPQLHFVHPKFPVVSVSAAESLTVVLPVPSHNKADEPFLRAVLAAMTTGGPGKAQADAPQCTHREVCCSALCTNKA